MARKSSSHHRIFFRGRDESRRSSRSGDERRRQQVKRVRSVAALLFVALAASRAHAGTDDVIRTAQTEISAVTQQAQNVQAAITKARAAQVSVEQRLANGELLFR